MQKLGKNIGSYQGETIDIIAVLRDIDQDARAKGWIFEPVAAGDGVELHTWHRNPTRDRARLYISSGIHGDEPAGPLAVRELIREDYWPDGVDAWLCPCLNPTGFLLNRRENAGGYDLNRQYLHLEAAETKAHVAWLRRTPAFDVTLSLHEDWESAGFYLYELNLDSRPSLAETIIKRVAQVCPIDPSSEIEGRPAVNGIIRPSLDPMRLQWPESYWLVKHKTRYAYTLEAPSDFPLATRVAALVSAVRTVLEDYEAKGASGD